MTRLVPLLGFAACITPATPDSRIDCPAPSAQHPRGEALQALLDSRAALGVPGVALAVRTEEGTWAGAAGMADLEGAIPMTPCHVHPWASVGKTWHAALALRLEEEGLLDLDDRLADHLPPAQLEGLANTDRVTLRQLMQHASGLRDFNEDMGYVTHELDDPGGDEPPAELLDWVRGDEALFPPGGGYHYADTNYVLLALVEAEVTGDRAAAMRDLVTDPLGLSHTSLPQPGEPDPEGRVNSYWELAGGRLENVSDAQADYDVRIIGGGNLRSTPEESRDFVSALVGGGLLGAASTGALVDWSTPSVEPDGFAYGLGVARHRLRIDGEPTDWVGHTGGDIGAAAIVLARPDRDQSLAFVVNLGGFLGGPLSATVDEAFVEELAQAMQPR